MSTSHGLRSRDDQPNPAAWMTKPRAPGPLASENYFKSAIRLGRQQPPTATEANTPNVLRGSPNRRHRRIHSETPLLSAVPSRTTSRPPFCAHDHNRVVTDPSVQWNAKRRRTKYAVDVRLMPAGWWIVKENFHNKPMPPTDRPCVGRSHSGRSNPTAEFASIGAHRAISLLSLAMKWHWLRKRLGDPCEIRGRRLTTISLYGCSLGVTLCRKVQSSPIRGTSGQTTNTTGVLRRPCCASHYLV